MPAERLTDQQIHDHLFADYRRAAAITAAFATRDGLGVQTVLNEAEAVGRLRLLVEAVLGVQQKSVDGFGSEAHVAVLRGMAATWARRAAAEEPPEQPREITTENGDTSE